MRAPSRARAIWPSSARACAGAAVKIHVAAFWSSWPITRRRGVGLTSLVRSPHGDFFCARTPSSSAMPTGRAAGGGGCLTDLPSDARHLVLYPSDCARASLPRWHRASTCSKRACSTDCCNFAAGSRTRERCALRSRGGRPRRYSTRRQACGTSKHNMRRVASARAHLARRWRCLRAAPWSVLSPTVVPRGAATEPQTVCDRRRIQSISAGHNAATESSSRIYVDATGELRTMYHVDGTASAAPGAEFANPALGAARWSAPAPHAMSTAHAESNGMALSWRRDGAKSIQHLLYS